MRKINKRGQEINYIVFLAIFLATFAIISSIFQKQIIEKTEQETSIIDKIINGISNIITWVGDNTLGKIPVVKDFWKVATSTVNFRFIQPYLGMIYLAFFGMPLGYIIIRLIRGGG